MRVILVILTTAILASCTTSNNKADDLAELRQKVSRLEKEQEQLLSSVRARDGNDKKLKQFIETRPRKAFVSRHQPSEYEKYVASCTEQVIYWGNKNYPEDARGRLFGKVIATFSVFASGQLEKISIDKSSGAPILDNAMKRAIEQSVPFPPFPTDMANKIDIISITTSFEYKTNLNEIE